MSLYAGQNVTPLEMLPDLEDLERDSGARQSMTMHEGNTYPPMGDRILAPDDAKRYAKYIRNDRRLPPPEAGMTSYGMDINVTDENNINVYTEPESNQMQYNSFRSFNLPHNSPSCIDIAEHIANCPICSKFYNTDKSIYIIAIIVLVILCILLLKKVLDI
jgi:hypothetical protein